MLIAAVAALAAVSCRPLRRRADRRARRDQDAARGADVPAGVPPPNCTIILTRVTRWRRSATASRIRPPSRRPAGSSRFTVGLSRLSTDARPRAHNDIHFLDQTYGGTTQVVGHRAARQRAPRSYAKWTVVGQSAIFHLQPYLGQVVQIPLPARALPVKPGDVVGLTIPTWAPVLSIQLPRRSSPTGRAARPTARTPPAQHTGPGGQGDRRVHVQLPRDAGRVHRHRDHQRRCREPDPRAAPLI